MLPPRDGLGPARLRVQGGNLADELGRRFGAAAPAAAAPAMDSAAMAAPADSAKPDSAAAAADTTKH